MSFEHWTPEQWTVFTVTVAVGVIAVAVLATLARARYVAPAPLLPDLRRVPRPSIVMTERRYTPPLLPDTGRPLPRIEPSRNVPIIAGELPGWVDPTMSDFTGPGIGALSSIQAVTIDPTLRTSAELQAEEDMWINAYSDLTYFMPETDAAREQMRINLEPALRTARLWLMRAGEVGAKAALSTWRMDTPTGEYPMLTTADLRPYAAALLVS